MLARLRRRQHLDLLLTGVFTVSLTYLSSDSSSLFHREEDEQSITRNNSPQPFAKSVGTKRTGAPSRACRALAPRARARRASPARPPDTVTPDGKKVYAANSLSNDVSVIDTATNRVAKTVEVGDGPWGIAMGR